MSSVEQTHFLSFYGDGPFWTDFLHLLAYPSNTNYIWPFRYPEELVHASLSERVKKGKRERRTLVGAEVIVGTRFQDQVHTNLFIPIRKAYIRRVELQAGIYQFHFFLGDSFDFRNVSSINDLSISVEIENGKLAFCCDYTDGLPDLCPATAEGDNWNSFSRLVSSETVLPINENAANGLWLKVLVGDGESRGLGIGIEKGSESWKWWRRKRANRSLFMYPSQSTRISFAHHLPSLEGKNTTLGEIDINVLSDNSSFELSTVGARAIGNYGVQEFSLAALSPTQITHKISFEFASDKLKSQNDKEVVQTTKYEVPIFVRWSLVHWLRSSALPVLALFLSLFVLGVSGLIERNIGKVIDGSITVSDIFAQWPLVLVVAIASACATLVMPFFKRGSNS